LFTVYVLYSKSFDKIYVGYTSALENRIHSHNEFVNKGWTKNFRPWELVYSETFNSKTEALKREKELKSSRGRAFIRENIIGKIEG
jgi:putative endonuclease